MEAAPDKASAPAPPQSPAMALSPAPYIPIPSPAIGMYLPTALAPNLPTVRATVGATASTPSLATVRAAVGATFAAA